jgi:hypothetical protein
MQMYNYSGVEVNTFTPDQGNFFMEDRDLSSLGKRLQYWLDTHNFGEWGGQVSFSQKTAIKQQQLSRYLNDEAEPSGPVRKRLAGAGVNLHWLDTGMGPMDAPVDEQGSGALLYPSEVGPMGEIVGEITLRVGDNEYDLTPLVTRKQRREQEEKGKTTEEGEGEAQIKK